MGISFHGVRGGIFVINGGSKKRIWHLMTLAASHGEDRITYQA